MSQQSFAGKIASFAHPGTMPTQTAEPAVGESHGLESVRKAPWLFPLLGIVLVTPGYARVTPESNLFLGMTYFHTGRMPEAIESVRKAIALKPGRVGCHFALGVMLKQQGDLAGARAEFQEELKAFPNHQPTLAQLRLLDQSSPPHASKQ